MSSNYAFEQLQKINFALQNEIKKLRQEKDMLQKKADNIYGGFICVLLQHCKGKTRILKNTFDTLRPGTMILSPKDNKYIYFEVVYPPRPQPQQKQLPAEEKSAEENDAASD